MFDPFQVLGLPRTFDLEARDVDAAHVRRMALLHPDIVGSDEAAQAAAAEINRARHALIDPERRAHALLGLIAGAAPAAPGTPPNALDKSLPPGFLMEMMETREAMESDLARDPAAARSTWQVWGEARRGEFVENVSQAFRACGAAPAGPPDGAVLSGIRTLLNQWRYIERLLEQLEPGYEAGKGDFR